MAQRKKKQNKEKFEGLPLKRNFIATTVIKYYMALCVLFCLIDGRWARGPSCTRIVLHLNNYCSPLSLTRSAALSLTLCLLGLGGRLVHFICTCGAN